MNRLLPFDALPELKHGMVALPNAASFSDSFFTDTLTSYAQGWRDPTNLEGMVNFMFPGVQVGRRFEFRKFGKDDDFITETDDTRATGADFKRVKYDGEITNSKTTNKGLTMIVDMDEVKDIPNWQELFTGRLLRRCKRNDLYTAVTALQAGATLTAKTWNASADPDSELITLVNTSGDSIGFNPSRVLFLGNTWTKRLTATRLSDKSGAFASSALTTPDQVAQYVGAEKGMYVSARIKSGSGKAKIGANNVIVFFAEDGAGPDDASNCKRFWTPCEGGGEYRVYVQELSPKLTAITVERYNIFTVCSTTGVIGHTIS